MELPGAEELGGPLGRFPCLCVQGRPMVAVISWLSGFRTGWHARVHWRWGPCLGLRRPSRHVRPCFRSPTNPLSAAEASASPSGSPSPSASASGSVSPSPSPSGVHAGGGRVSMARVCDRWLPRAQNSVFISPDIFYFSHAVDWRRVHVDLFPCPWPNVGG